MTRFDQYKDDYKSIKMERRNGILQMTFHSRGWALIWGHVGGAHAEFAHAFGDVTRRSTQSSS